jgi:hypothetical protein
LRKDELAFTLKLNGSEMRTNTPWIYLVAEGTSMVVMQLGLLKVQYFSRQNPRLKPLSTFEICSVVAVLWMSYIALAGITTGVLGFISPLGGTDRGGEPHGRRYGVVFLFYKTLWTWVLHRGLTFGLENVDSFWTALLMDSTALRKRIKARLLEVAESLRDIDWRKPLGSGLIIEDAQSLSDQKACQLISLERHKSRDPVEGSRTLNWNIAIDKKALDEMKETLGPPGGFGEMGFNVTGEGVSFEAMGIGTRFNLSFSLRKSKIGETGARSPKKKKKGL